MADKIPVQINLNLSVRPCTQALQGAPAIITIMGGDGPGGAGPSGPCWGQPNRPHTTWLPPPAQAGPEAGRASFQELTLTT